MAATPAPPRISIITPNLNQGRFLEACLLSVAAQKYPRVRHIVIDGGSTDESLTVIEKHAARLDYWCSERDSGQSNAINKGLLRANGEIVTWLNADDYLLPGALDSVAAAYLQDPEAPFYFGNGSRVDEHGKSKGDFFPYVPVAFDRVALVYGLNYLLQPSTFMRREALLAAGPLDESLRWGMDSELWMRLSALGTPRFVPGLLSATREYADTKTATGMFERVEELRQIAKRHSGAEITPGVICYLLDTLHRYAAMREDVLDRGYRSKAIEPFWAATAAQMARFGARSDGFPVAGTTSRR